MLVGKNMQARCFARPPGPTEGGGGPTEGGGGPTRFWLADWTPSLSAMEGRLVWVPADPGAPCIVHTLVAPAGVLAEFCEMAAAFPDGHDPIVVSFKEVAAALMNGAELLEPSQLIRLMSAATICGVWAPVVFGSDAMGLSAGHKTDLSEFSIRAASWVLSSVLRRCKETPATSPHAALAESLLHIVSSSENFKSCREDGVRDRQPHHHTVYQAHTWAGPEPCVRPRPDSKFLVRVYYPDYSVIFGENNFLSALGHSGLKTTKIVYEMTAEVERGISIEVTLWDIPPGLLREKNFLPKLAMTPDSVFLAIANYTYAYVRAAEKDDDAPGFRRVAEGWQLWLWLAAFVIGDCTTPTIAAAYGVFCSTTPTSLCKSICYGADRSMLLISCNKPRK